MGLKITPILLRVGTQDFFDIPYLRFQELLYLLDTQIVKQFSPWNLVERQEIFIRGRMNVAYRIQGVADLDYIGLI